MLLAEASMPVSVSTTKPRPSSVTRAGNSRLVRPLLYAFAITALFVAVVMAVAVRTGTESAMVVAVIAMGLCLTAFGVWGAALAVKETIRSPMAMLNDSHDEVANTPSPRTTVASGPRCK
jgi:Flp pilus assembly protein TadB